MKNRNMNNRSQGDKNLKTKGGRGGSQRDSKRKMKNSRMKKNEEKNKRQIYDNAVERSLQASKISGKVDMSNHNLKKMPKKLSFLDHLTSPFSPEEHLIRNLNLSDNNIESIDKEIVFLKNLQILNFSRNNLKEIPEEIFLLQNLKKIDFSKNQIGMIPERFCDCLNLYEANFSFNKIKNFPLEIHKIGKFGILEYFYLRGNNLEEIDYSVRKNYRENI